MRDTATLARQIEDETFRNVTVDLANFKEAAGFSEDTFKSWANKVKALDCPLMTMANIKRRLIGDATDDYQIYNVMADVIIRGNVTRKIVAFMILLKNGQTLEIDYACTWPGARKKRVMSKVVDHLKTQWRGPIVVEAIRDPTAIKFWYQRGFRFVNAEDRNQVEPHLGNLKISDLRGSLYEMAWTPNA